MCLVVLLTVDRLYIRTVGVILLYILRLSLISDRDEILLFSAGTLIIPPLLAIKWM